MEQRKKHEEETSYNQDLIGLEGESSQEGENDVDGIRAQQCRLTYYSSCFSETTRYCHGS